MIEDEFEKLWISQITIENYKSINNASVKLNPGLNIIIGKNGAGKSNLLTFINSYSTLPGLFGGRVHRSSKANYTIEFSFKINKSDHTFNRVIFKHEKRLVKNEKNEVESLNALSVEGWKEKVLDYRYSYTYHDRMQKTEIAQRKAILEKVEFIKAVKTVFVQFYIPEDDNLNWLKVPARLDYDGSIGASIDEYSSFDFIYEFEVRLEAILTNKISKSSDDIDSIKQIVSEAFYDYSHKINIITQIRNYSPIADLRLNPNINVYRQEERLIIENLIIDFNISDTWISWNQLSDGTKRLFHLITQSVFIDNGILIIEEPELGIHPSQLYQLMDFIKKKSFTNQVILSTHSPLVLDILSPTELKKVTIAKMSREGTKFSKLSKQKEAKAKKYILETGDLSHYWLHSDLEEDD